MQKKSFVFTVLICFLCLLTSCQKHDNSMQNEVDNLLSSLEQKYPDHLCWNNGWYETQYYEIDYTSNHESYKYINVNCYLEFFTDEYNKPTMTMKQFHTKQKSIDAFFTTTVEEFCDGTQYYTRQLTSLIEDDKQQIQSNFVTNDYKIYDESAYGPFKDNSLSRPLHDYSYVEYDANNDLIIYKMVSQLFFRYCEIEFHFDENLNFLKYRIFMELRDKDNNINTGHILKTYSFIIYPSDSVIIEIPKDIESNVNEFNTKFTFEDIFMDIKN